jgi:hypothetical protein
MNYYELFGVAGGCSTLKDALELIRTNHGAHVRAGAAARGMFLHASGFAVGSAHVEDTRFVLDQLVRAKAEIDIVAWHSIEVVAVTETILNRAQRYFDEQTIGSNEWPTPSEVVDLVLKVISDLSKRWL